MLEILDRVGYEVGESEQRLPNIKGATTKYGPVSAVCGTLVCATLVCGTTVRSAYGKECLWYGVPMVRSAYGKECLW